MDNLPDKWLEFIASIPEEIRPEMEQMYLAFAARMVATLLAALEPIINETDQ